MMSNDKQRPEITLADGNIKASIWKRESEKGSFYVTDFTKTYRDERGDYQNSRSFTGADLLKLSELSRQAYQQSRELYYRDRQSERGDKQRSRDYDRER